MIHRLLSLLPMLALVLLASVSFWLERAARVPTAGEKPLRHDPDFWVEHFTVRSHDETGKLRNTLEARKMTHYLDGDATVIEAPRITYHQSPPLRLSAESGLVSDDGKEISFIGATRLEREGAKSAPPTRLDTRLLRIYPDEERAESPQAVTVTQGRSVIRGSGLAANHKTGITVLKGRVSAVIERRS